MGDVLVYNDVSISLFLEFIVFLFLTFAVYKTFFILYYYQEHSSSVQQYKQEKNAYLVETVISLAIFMKIALLLFFLYTIDSLSEIIPGAMCASGVIEANIYGEKTLFFKLFTIFVSALWLVLNAEDEKAKQRPYFRLKFYIFIVIYLFMGIELFLEIEYFTHISTDTPVLCCSAVYTTEESEGIVFGLKGWESLSLFYGLFLLLIISLFYKKRSSVFVLAPLFLYVSYYLLVYVFALYIYELPTHKCPFCILGVEYYFIGYFIFIFISLATFYAWSASIFNFTSKHYRLSALFYLLFVVITSWSFITYLLRTGKLLTVL